MSPKETKIANKFYRIGFGDCYEAMKKSAKIDGNKFTKELKLLIINSKKIMKGKNE